MLSKLLNRTSTLYEHVITALASLAGTLIVALMLTIGLAVFMRYLLNQPQAWVLEATEYAVVWITFLSAAWILAKEGHVMVELVTARLKPRTQALLCIITSILGAVLCIIVVVYGTQVVIDHFQRSVRMETTAAPLKAPFLSIIPIGSLLVFVQFLRRTYGYIEQWKALSGKNLDGTKANPKN